ncbi:MAG TPA: glycosyltransferase family 4 protein [Thermoleophilaceae bacterium]|nr:glycosyltransferase family 4 protein [Thermoleophilaceae bacterium]
MSEHAASADAERPRIAHVGPDPERPGGMAAVMRGLLDSPLADRYSLDLIVTYTTRDRLRRTAVFARALWRLARWCRGAGDRLVHVHTAVRGSIYRKALCVVVARLAGRPVLLQLHAGAGDIDVFAARLGPVRRWLLGAAMRAAGAVVSVSDPGARRIEHCFGVRDVVVVPNAAPPVGEPAPPDPGADASGCRVLYMGGFVNDAKGGAVLVEALPALLEACPGLEVVLAGTGAPPEAFNALARERPNVSWAGWLDAEAKAAQLARCDVFVMPSLSEGMPVALLEAMAYGRAIVASEVGGIPDVVADGTQAVLVPRADPVALTAAVARVVADPSLRERLGAAARERAADFAADAVYDSLAAVYDRLLTESRASLRR